MRGMLVGHFPGCIGGQCGTSTLNDPHSHRSKRLPRLRQPFDPLSSDTGSARHRQEPVHMHASHRYNARHVSHIHKTLTSDGYPASEDIHPAPARLPTRCIACPGPIRAPAGTHHTVAEIQRGFSPHSVSSALLLSSLLYYHARTKNQEHAQFFSIVASVYQITCSAGVWYTKRCDSGILVYRTLRSRDLGIPNDAVPSFWYTVLSAHL